MAANLALWHPRQILTEHISLMAWKLKKAFRLGLAKGQILFFFMLEFYLHQVSLYLCGFSLELMNWDNLV